MKTKLTKAKSKSALGRVRQLFITTACLGAVILICSSASARNLFMSDGYSGLQHNLGHIYKFRLNGQRTTFASGLSSPRSLAFNISGNLFVACVGNGHIYKFQPNGVRTTFASGLSYPYALAFDGGGNL